MEDKKSLAIYNEDYYTAKIIKNQILQLRLMISPDHIYSDDQQDYK
jgi:hypothetical protein